MTKVNKIILAFLLIFAPHLAYAAPHIFFSDMTDAPVTGWEGSATKGAAITIWGTGFGETRDTSTVTVANSTSATSVELTNSADYAEWAATTSPITPMWNGKDHLQRICFYLNSAMGVGGGYQNSTIKVTVGGVDSNLLPFHARAIGSNHIYFYDLAGSDANDGLYVTQGVGTNGPRATLGDMKETVAAGDVAYVGAGTWQAADTNGSYLSGSYALIAFYWPNLQWNNGSEGASISVSAYPGASVILDGATNSYYIWKRHGTGNQLLYWTFSKFTTIGTYDNSSSHNGVEDHVRLIGFDLNSEDGQKTIYTGNCGKSQTYFYMLGNYFHDAGCGANRGCVPSAGDAYGFSFSGAGNYDIDRGAGDVGHQHIYVQYNEVGYNSQGHAFYIYGHQYDDNIEDLHIESNYFHDNAFSGAILGGGDSVNGDGNYGFVADLYFINNIVANNASQGVRAGDSASDTDGGGGEYFIYNNTLYGNYHCWSFSAPATLGATIHLSNNICYDTNGYLLSDECNTVATCSGASNIFYGNVDGMPAYFSSNINSDPLFVVAGDYSLQSGSPAVDAGADLSAVFTDDIMGVTRPESTAYDIGAFEYLAGEADIVDPTVFISTQAQTVHCDSITVAWEDGDNIAVTGRKWRIGSAPDGSNGTAATSPATVTGMSIGDNTIYIGAGDAAGNWGSDSIAITYTGICQHEVSVGGYRLTGANGVYSSTGAIIQ